MALGHFTAKVSAGYPNCVIEQVAPVLQMDWEDDDSYVALVRQPDGTALLVTTSYGAPTVCSREFLECARNEHQEALTSIDALLSRFPA